MVCQTKPLQSIMASTARRILRLLTMMLSRLYYNRGTKVSHNFEYSTPKELLTSTVENPDIIATVPISTSIRLNNQGQFGERNMVTTPICRMEIPKDVARMA
jgi:hypothetical protein